MSEESVSPVRRVKQILLTKIILTDPPIAGGLSSLQG